MSAPMLTVCGILAGAIVLFAWGRPRVDIVAILVVLALMLSRVLTPPNGRAVCFGVAPSLNGAYNNELLFGVGGAHRAHSIAVSAFSAESGQSDVAIGCGQNTMRAVRTGCTSKKERRGSGGPRICIGVTAITPLSRLSGCALY
jgi:hypothetical protein